MANKSINLLSSPSRVETPFIKITIGEYTFGVFDKVTAQGLDDKGVYTINKIKYPNYVQSLQIEKINGVVNKYTLNISYPITEADDPNFFYKVFSSVAQTRTIIFSYGDLSAPEYCYRDEEALILKVRQRVAANSSVINYTVTAISKGKMSTVGAFNFTSSEFVGRKKASSIIKKVLYEPKYGLQDVFYGMSNKALVEAEGLILSDDIEVNLIGQTNISPIDYILYLVDCMKSSTSGGSSTKNAFYSLVVVDDTTGKFKGPYFKIIKVQKAVDIPSAYNLDIGYPSQNIVTEFDIEDDEGYTIFFNFYEKLNTDQYVKRINDRGEVEEVYAPVLGTNNAQRVMTEKERDWWTKVTEFPIKAKLTVKGLLRPAVLMTHIRLNVYFYGRKHLSSGLYIITKQVDEVGYQGFRTTLSLLRVGKDEELDII